jgi:excisionase family DNA binding protein
MERTRPSAPTDDKAKEWYSMRKAADRLGICTNTAYKMVREGTFPAPVYRMGRSYRIPVAAIERIVAGDE